MPSSSLVVPPDSTPGHEEPAGCHICGAPAAGRCRQCHRPVCSGHVVSLAAELQPLLGPDACRECADRTAGELARGEGRWARKRALDREQQTCAICHREFDQVLPRCSRCGRSLCPEHGLQYRKKFRFGAKGRPEEAWYWDLQVRCHRHRLAPVLARLTGWSEVAGDAPGNRRSGGD